MMLPPSNTIVRIVIIGVKDLICPLYWQGSLNLVQTAEVWAIRLQRALPKAIQACPSTLGQISDELSCTILTAGEFCGEFQILSGIFGHSPGRLLLKL